MLFLRIAGSFFSRMKEEFENLNLLEIFSQVEKICRERETGFFVWFLLGNSGEQSLFHTTRNSEENGRVAKVNGEQRA